MQDYRTLKLLDHFEKVFTHFGVDYKIMRRILQVKLTMDGRRVPTVFSQNAKKQGKELNNQYIKSLWIYVLFSLFMIPLILIDGEYLFQMSLVYGMFTFLVMTSMISDFSSVLLDIRDRNILYPKPIDKKTISTAKMMHVVIYLMFLTIALVGIPLVIGLIKHGVIFFLVSTVSIMLIDLFVVVVTACIYLLILRFFDGEKLKDIINYVQIGLSFAVMIGYQLLSRSFELVNLSISFEEQWWHMFVFPIWYGATMDMLMTENYQLSFVLFTVLGVFMPIIAIWLYMKFNFVFEENVQKLAYHGKVKEKKRTKLGQRLLHVLCRSQQERAFFRFASLMMKNEREFKLKVYPSLGFSIVIPFIFIFNGFNDMESLSSGKTYLTIYFSLIIVPTIMVLLKFSGKYKGAWIFKVAPMDQLKPMFNGTIKAFIVNLYLPVYLLLSVIFVVLFGVRVLPDLVVVFLNACLFVAICFMMLKKVIPFSESFDVYNHNGNMAILIGSLLIVAVLAALHYISTLFNYGIYLYLVTVLICLVVIWKVAFNIKWQQIYE